MCFSLAAVVSETDNEKHGLTLGANKIRELVDKCIVDKRNHLVKALVIDVDYLFPNSEDDIRAISPSEQLKKKPGVLVIP